MADDRKITITILDSSESVGSENDGSSSEKLGVEEQLNATLKKMYNPVKDSAKKSEAKSVLINQTIEMAKKTFLNNVMFSLRRSNTLLEDYMGEMQLQHITTAINKGIGLGTAIASGASIGSKAGGVVGGAIGAGIGILSWGTNEFISGQATRSGIYQNLNENVFQTEFSATRAGLINNSRGTEN